MVSPIFICGMAPLDFDDPMYGIFRCDPSLLDCNTHIEADFYTSRIKAKRIELCCYCAGEFNSRVELNSNLKYPYGTLLCSPYAKFAMRMVATSLYARRGKMHWPRKPGLRFRQTGRRAAKNMVLL